MFGAVILWQGRIKLLAACIRINTHRNVRSKAMSITMDSRGIWMVGMLMVGAEVRPERLVVSPGLSEHEVMTQVLGVED
jgi:hypothetical protein